MASLEQVQQPQQVEGDAVSTGLPTPLQFHYLSRLERLVEMREEQIKSNPGDKQALRLLARALYSTYMDCVSSGIGDRASALMEKPRSSAAS